MKDLLEFILGGIIPGKEFKVSESGDGDRIDFSVSTAPENVGLIIGKGGHMIRAIRSILRIRATLEKKVVYLEVLG